MKRKKKKKRKTSLPNSYWSGTARYSLITIRLKLSRMEAYLSYFFVLLRGIMGLARAIIEMTWTVMFFPLFFWFLFWYYLNCLVLSGIMSDSEEYSSIGFRGEACGCQIFFR